MPNQNFNTLSAANPYRNQPYKKSVWQNFLSALGFRTQADAWQENMSVQAAEYDAALAQKQFDTEYNDPQSQVERMKAAGLNPDIDPSSIDSGSAAPMGEDPSTPMQSTGEEGVLLDFANGVMNAFTTAIGLTTSVQGVVRNRLQNKLLGLQNESAFSEFAKGMFPYLLPNSPESVVDEDTGMESSWQANALQMAQMYAGTLPKSMQRKFMRNVQAFWSSAPGSAEAYKEWKNRVSNRKGYYEESSTFYDEQNEVMRIIADGLSEVNEEIYRSRQQSQLQASKADFAEDLNREEYADNLDAGLQASAENAQNDLNRSNAMMVGTLRKSLEGMIDKLDKASQDNSHPLKSGLATMTMGLLSVLQLYISTQGMPSVSRSSSFGSSPKGQTFNSSWSIGF